MTESCQFCGARLAVGAVACFRCGKMVYLGGVDASTGGGSAPTQLGTQARGELLEGQWRLVKPIGQGTMGVVWEGRDVGLDRPVAVKLMHEGLVFDAVAGARFERESRVLATLEHPHVVPILGVGKHRSQPFLVMKLLEGRSLGELLHTRGGKLPATEAVLVLSKLCEALDFVHGRGVLHRDLKPSNVFVGNEGQVWLLDLGLAHEPGSDLTKTGDVVGSISYLSPEQLHGKRELDRRTDVFALGCLAFEAFTGAPPFTGEVLEVLAHQLHTPPPDANALAPSLPQGLGAVLQKAMAKIPLERHAIAGDFAAEVQRVCGIAADGTVTRNERPAAALVMPQRRSSREVPITDGVKPKLQLEATTDPREAVTTPSDPLVPAVRAPAPDDDATPMAGVSPWRAARPLEDETTVLGKALPAREGPTGPIARQRREAFRRAFIGLSVAATVTLGFIAVAFAVRPAEPPAPQPLPLEQRPETSVALVEPLEKPKVDTSMAFDLEPLKPKNVVMPPLGAPAPPKPEPYDMRTARARLAQNNAGAVLEVVVFSPMKLGHKPIKAEVWLDSQKKGFSPLRLNVAAGPHYFEILTEEYPMTDIEVYAAPGKTQRVEIEMIPPGHLRKPPASLTTPHPPPTR